MDNIDLAGGDLKRHNNVANPVECNQKCQKDDECTAWTYKDALCYLKNDETFEHYIDWALSGTKNCNKSGYFNIIYKSRCFVFLLRY